MRHVTRGLAIRCPFVLAIVAGVVAISLFAACGGSNRAPVSTPAVTQTVASTRTAATAESSCAAAQDVIVDDARFVAFDGALRPHPGGKLLVVLLRRPPPEPGATPLTSDKFTLLDAQNNVYEAMPDPSVLAPGRTAEAGILRLSFDVPRTLGTGKLLYQAGCGTQSWDIP